MIAAAGLQYFLIPNHLLDGGITGIAIIFSYMSGLPLGVFLIILNIPFLLLGYKKFGRNFALLSLVGVIMLSVLTLLFHSSTGFTGDKILAAAFGGVFVGLGVGLVLRYGGTLDGLDTVAILIDKFTIFSVGEAIMIINVFIMGAAGFVFGWDHAMYSLIAYFVAHKAIDVTVEGLDESRSVWIVSEHYKEIGKVLKLTTGRKVTYFKDNNVEDGQHRGIILSVITRFEEYKIKSLIQGIDDKAFIMIASAHEIIGKNFSS